MYELVYCSWFIVVSTAIAKGLTTSTRLSEDWNRVSILHSNGLLDFTIRSRTTDEQTQNCLKSSCSHVLGNKKVHGYHVPSQKKTSSTLRQINSNFKFPSRIKTIVSQKFLGIAKCNFRTKDWSCYGQIVFVTADGQISPELFDITKIDMLLFVFTVCLHLEQAFETLLKENEAW